MIGPAHLAFARGSFNVLCLPILCIFFFSIKDVVVHSLIAMSFGFSVGDFIAGANLAYQLLRALSDSQGASKEYQEVIQELGCVQQTFLHVEQMRSCNLFSRATLNAVSYIINSSVDVISNFFARTEKYRRSLSGNGGQSLYRDSWRKVGWSLFKKEELTGLRDTLQTRLTAIAILVNTASQ